METKVCNICGLEKELNEFHKAKNNNGGYFHQCKICHNSYYHEHRKEVLQNVKNRYEIIKNDKELYFKYLQTSKKSRKNRDLIIKEKEKTLKRKFQNWRSCARRRGFEFNLTLEQIENLPFKCFYTNLDLTCERDRFNTVSLDRIDSLKGYTLDNIVLCCAMINYMKLDADIKKFVELCELVYKNKEHILTLNKK